MFNLEQIKTARQKFKSGADFPKYIHEIKQLGVQAYETFVADSHTVYFGSDGYQQVSDPMYETLIIAADTDKDKFLRYLQSHQKGETDYLTFCRHCAETGVEKWAVSLTAMTCTYFNKSGDQLLVEQIPG